MKKATVITSAALLTASLFLMGCNHNTMESEKKMVPATMADETSKSHMMDEGKDTKMMGGTMEDESMMKSDQMGNEMKKPMEEATM